MTTEQAKDPREENLAAAMKQASALCKGLLADLEKGPLPEGSDVKVALGRLDALAVRCSAVAEGVSIVGERSRAIVSCTLDALDSFEPAAESE